MELEAPGGWTAGPLHVHPRAQERLTVLEGRLEARYGRFRRPAVAGDVVVVPPGVPHTVRAESAVRLRVEFDPPLRTDRLFFEMYGGGGRAPSRLLPAWLRAWLESRGYGDEIRYLWPRRVLLTALALGTLVTAGERRRA
jgi:hypothetical protein